MGCALLLLRSRWAVRRTRGLDAAAILNGIQKHREHDDRAGEHCLPVGRDADDDQPIGKEPDDEGAEERSADIAATARQRGAANDGRLTGTIEL